MITFVSYFTKQTPYEEEVKKLIASLKKWGLKYYIQAENNLGTWDKNTKIKARFLKEMLLKCRDPIVYIDADAEVQDYPLLFTIIKDYYDIGFYTLDWNQHYGYNHTPSVKEACNGTLYLVYNDKVLRFLDDWIKENKKHNKWEQKIMEDVLKKHKNLNIYSLPSEYCCIIKKDGSMPDYLTSNPVIVHFQKSRDYKRLIHPT